MGKLKCFLVCLICLVVCRIHATDSTLNYALHKSIKGNFSTFSLDNLGNIFLVTDNNQIKKLNQNFDSVGVFNDTRRYGKITLVDASNPLKILVYYKDFATIIVLDRFLNIRNTIDLRSQNILQVKAIAQSYDNNIWLFDELDARIKKVDETGKVLSTSADFRMLFDEVPNPSTIIDADGMLYLYNTQNGWLVFDYYGALKTKYSIANWYDVQVINSTLLGHNKKQFVLSQPQTLSISSYSTNIDLSNAIKAIHNKNLLYVLTKDLLTVYEEKNKINYNKPSIFFAS
jgi:hypothetical protein